MPHSVLQISPTSQGMVSPETPSAPAPTAAEKALNEGRAAFILSRAAERAALNNHRILFQRRRRFGLAALILAALTLAGLVGGGRIATGDSDAGRYSAPIAAYAPTDEVGSLPDAPVHNLWGFVP